MKKSKYDASEIWIRLCEFVREDDGLPVYECGTWTINKLHFLGRYLAIFSNAMKNNPYLTGINYIDLFCGSGICVSPKDDPSAKRYPGSVLLAAGCPKQFDRMFMVDAKAKNIEALRQRMERLRCQSQIFSYSIDANDAVDKIIINIPNGSLSIAFIDPFSLQFRFETLQDLTFDQKMDLVILFPDAMNVIRNIKYYLKNPNSPLDLVLGDTSDWRNAYSNLVKRDGPSVRALFRNLYVTQIRKLGYEFQDTKVIDDNGKPLYTLVYASKNKLGLKFWKSAIELDRQGQRNLFT